MQPCRLITGKWGEEGTVVPFMDVTLIIVIGALIREAAGIASNPPRSHIHPCLVGLLFE